MACARVNVFAVARTWPLPVKWSWVLFRGVLLKSAAGLSCRGLTLTRLPR